jgi:hypothetical protein
METALPFRGAAEDETVTDKFTGTVRLSRGRSAVVEMSRGFTLVPWRPLVDRRLGIEVMGVGQGGIGIMADETTAGPFPLRL